MDPRLEALRAHPYDDEPMFYPPGKHPATARWRANLRDLGLLGYGSSDEAYHIRQLLANFEEQETDLKLEYLNWLEGK